MKVKARFLMRDLVFGKTIVGFINGIKGLAYFKDFRNVSCPAHDDKISLHNT